MSVLIKDMEMPTNCDVCFMRDACEYSMPLGKRLTECPLIEIPPHGRLIDADALADRCSRQATDEWNKSTGTNWGYAYATFESDVEDAPTVIEAEEGE